MSSDACINAVREAVGDKLSVTELESVFERAQAIRKRIIAEGKLDDLTNNVIKEIDIEADKLRIAAALQRRHAALNALVRDKLDNHIATMVADGLDPEQAILSYMEGTTRSAALGRVSVYATRQAFETKYMGGMMAELVGSVPHVKRLVDDPAFSNDVVREMAEIGKEGKPGVTNNADAVKVAEIFAKYAEMSRVDLNKFGAMIGRLDRWGGPHRHDAYKIGSVPKDEWIRTIDDLLDYDKTFKDVTDPAKIKEILGNIYDEVITGQPNRLTSATTGQIVGPANLANALQKSRVLHFKNADAWIAYNDKFGDGNIFNAMIAHQERSAAHAAQMMMFGPNPEIMLQAKIDDMRRQVKVNPNLSSKAKRRLIERLDMGKGGSSQKRLAAAFLEMQGITMSTSNLTAGKINQDIRNVSNFATLGAATMTAVPTDTMTAAAASMFRGGGFYNGMADTLGELLTNASPKEAKIIAHLLGEQFDGFISRTSAAHFANDGVVGATTKLTTRFFELTGLTGWTDKLRGASSRTISSEMALRSRTSFNKLPDAYKQLMERHGIGDAQWNAIRKADFRALNGKQYITPDLMRHLPDGAVEHLISDRMVDVRSRIKDPVKIAKTRQRLLDDARFDLEVSTSRFFADEVNFSVVETDAASRRIMLRGTRPGTAFGEAARYVGHLKGFPAAFTQRIGGRAFFALKGPDRVAAYKHLGALLSSLTFAGYMTIVTKDALKGRWPPKDISDPKVFFASMMQGGAIGIYGDFLFGEGNRFGNRFLETLAGPVPATVSNIVGLGQRAVRGEASAGEALNTAIRITPFNNLWYTRPVIDALFLNSMREWASPGYRRRLERRLQEDYEQELLF